MIDLHDLQAEAFRLGFFVADVTTAEPPIHFHSYMGWLSNGYHGGMAYLANKQSLAKRKDPRLLKPGTESILVLGFRHAPPLPAKIGEVRAAAYSAGLDYHKVMKAKLPKLADRLIHLAGRQVSWSGYSDSAPILERSLAGQTGMGWIGRNSCLIIPGVGSFFLLAEIFLDERVQSSSKEGTDHCGTCTRCIEACPTGCILPGRIIDARRCISYLTIENKGVIPLELRKSVGSWVFGCDICQLVCPWNNHPLDMSWDCIPELKPSPGWPPADLNREMSISQATFNSRFQDSPLSRVRRTGYLRNLAVVLGNRKDPESVPSLAKSLLEEPEPLVRLHSAWALGQINDQRSRQALERGLKLEMDPFVCSEITMALEGFG